MRLVIALLCVLWFVACDTPYGIYRSADVAFVPSPDTVLAIIRTTPGVDSVQYDVDSRTSSRDTIYTFTYEGSAGVQGVIQFTRTKSGIQFNQYLQQLNSPPPQHQVDTTLPVMRAIEQRLKMRAGLAGLDNVKQSCTGVKC